MERKNAPEPARDICVMYCTAPPSHAAGLARSLIEKNLVACVNINTVRSLYRWNGEVCDEEEHLLIIKTRRGLADAVITAIKLEHPYDVPEIIALPVIAGHPPYLDWVYRETREP